MENFCRINAQFKRHCFLFQSRVSRQRPCCVQVRVVSFCSRESGLVSHLEKTQRLRRTHAQESRKDTGSLTRQYRQRHHSVEITLDQEATALNPGLRINGDNDTHVLTGSVFHGLSSQQTSIFSGDGAGSAWHRRDSNCVLNKLT